VFDFTSEQRSHAPRAARSLWCQRLSKTCAHDYRGRASHHILLTMYAGTTGYDSLSSRILTANT
jgi:hypothetical protein